MKLSAALLLSTALLCVTGATLAADPQVKPWGVELSYIDKSVKPGDDFFVYANGNWLKHDTIPADRTYSGVNLELDLQNEARLKGLVADLAKTPDDKLSPEGRKLRDLYNAYMDTTQIEASGLAPAQKDLAKIAGYKTLSDVAAGIGDPAMGLDGPFAYYIGSDDKNSDIYSVNLYQSGLGMPDRDYYLKTDKEIVATQAAYKKYIAQMLTIAGVADAGARAEKIYALEAALAQASWPAADRRDADKIYNPMTVADLKKLAPGFDWDAMFTSAGIPENAPAGERMVIVGEKSAFPNLAKVFAETPVAVWRDYMTVRYLHRWSAYLPKKVDDTDFAFYGTALGGKTAQLERPTRGIKLLDNSMGEALGHLYVAKYFPPEAKAKALALVQNMLKAYDADIRTLAWMTPATRAKAIEKLHATALKIGYPDTFRDYSALAIDRNLLADVKAATVFEWNRQLRRIDGPVDRTEWGMTPPTNNAYNNPNLNEVVFPAGILQPPYFDPNADDAVNYGEIGATIGHELSHSFDDQGAKYNARGNLENWFTPADLEELHQARVDAIAAQYDQYEPLPGLHINGRLTLGENIADIAGLVIALKAYHISLGGKPAPVLNGLTGDQRFYIAYAQSWRERHRDGAIRSQVLSNPHSPSEFRVNGVVRNTDGWYAAFDIKPGDKYYLPPDKRVPVW